MTRTRIAQPHRRHLVAPLLSLLLVAAPMVKINLTAATFDGNAHLEVTDSSGSLSWIPATNALTVAFWVKISIPTGVAQDMTLLVNRRDGNWSQPHAFRFYLEASTAEIKFSAYGSSALPPITLVRHPYVDRWYHLGVVRSGDTYTPYVDGRALPQVSQSIGTASTTSGVGIGGSSTAPRLYGEIQEVAIYQQALTRPHMVANMYRDIPVDSYELKGYFKLGYSADPNDNLKNFAASPPAGTEYAAKSGSGTIEFPESDEQGEQSVFDSRKNGGRDAIAALPGTFAWSQTAIGRPTPGIPFAFEFGYSSGIANSGHAMEGGTDIYGEDAVMGPGWRHSFQTRLVPGSLFMIASSKYLGLLDWNGNLETWERLAGGVFKTLHGEYRGELREVDTETIEWTTPGRLVYKFYHPTNSLEEMLMGRLAEIRDFNGNRVSLTYDLVLGRLTQVTDTGSGAWKFNYNAQGLLTSVTGPTEDAATKWTVSFAYDGNNRLASKSISGPASYRAPTSTKWQFSYTTSAPTGLLEKIVNPGGKDEIRQVKYDSYGRVIEEKDALDRVAKTEYHKPAKQQMRVTDARSNVWITTFDRRNHVIAAADPLSNTSRFGYDEGGNLKSSTDPNQNTTTYSYDTRSNRILTTDALTRETRATYHSFFNRPLTTTDANDWIQHFEYDWNEGTGTGTGNLLRHWDDLGDLVQYTYTPAGSAVPPGLVKTKTDARGEATTYDYTAEGFLASVTEPGNHTTTFTYNELGWLLTQTNALGETSTRSYDVNGRMIQQTDALQRETSFAYDLNGNLLSETDPRGYETAYTYNDANERVSKTTPDNRTWNYEYSPTGKLVKTIRPLVTGESERYELVREYDQAERLLKVYDPKQSAEPLGICETYTYDAAGNVTHRLDRALKAWKTRYDALNRPVEIEDPLGKITSTTYDKVGRIETITGPNGNVSRNEYDGRGRLIRWTDPSASLWEYAYDGNANITVITDALGGRYEMEYGPRSERTRETNQDGFVWNYTYDELLRPKTQTDPNGLTRTHAYDAGGRLVSITHGSGRIDVITRDENDNILALARVATGEATTSLFSYDSMNRLTECRDPYGKVVRYAYDELGRRKTLTYPGGKSLQMAYDPLDRMTSQTDWLGNVTAYTYDNVDRILTRQYPNGILQENTFDANGRLATMRYSQTAGGATLLAYAQGYDGNGNVIASDTGNGYEWPTPSRIDETASYTASGRLETRTDAADGTGGRNFTYTFDDAGNLVHAANPTVTYDFTYDEDNRTTSITYDTGLTSKLIRNRYDALGRRISRRIDANETHFVLDLGGGMERTLCDTDATGAVKTYYVHGTDLTYAIDAATAAIRCSYHADPAANIAALGSPSGALTSRYAYTPYGRMFASIPDDGNEYRFVGSQGVMEELPSLCFMRARYYCADSGTFFSVDPVRTAVPTRMSQIYQYGSSSPLSQVDPTGEIAILLPIVYGAIMAVETYAAVRVGVPVAIYAGEGLRYRVTGDVVLSDVERTQEQAERVFGIIQFCGSIPQLLGNLGNAQKFASGMAMASSGKGWNFAGAMKYGMKAVNGVSEYLLEEGAATLTGSFLQKGPVAKSASPTSNSGFATVGSAKDPREGATVVSGSAGNQLKSRFFGSADAASLGSVFFNNGSFYAEVSSEYAGAINASSKLEPAAPASGSSGGSGGSSSGGSGGGGGGSAKSASAKLGPGDHRLNSYKNILKRIRKK